MAARKDKKDYVSISMHSLNQKEREMDAAEENKTAIGKHDSQKAAMSQSFGGARAKTVKATENYDVQKAAMSQSFRVERTKTAEATENYVVPKAAMSQSFRVARTKTAEGDNFGTDSFPHDIDSDSSRIAGEKSGNVSDHSGSDDDCPDVDSGSQGGQQQQTGHSSTSEANERNISGDQVVEGKALVEEAWEDILFQIFTDGPNAPPDSYKVKGDTHIVMIQFAVQKNVSSEVKEIFKEKNIQLDFNSTVKFPILSFKGAQKITMEEVWNIFKEEVFPLIQSEIVASDSKEAECMFVKLKEKMPRAMKVLKGAVYNQKSMKSIIVIGENTRFQSLLKDLEIPPKVPERKPNYSERTNYSDRIELSTHDRMLLTHLDFEKHLQGQFKGVRVSYSQSPSECLIENSNSTPLPGQTKVNEFLNRVQSVPLTLKDKFCYNLLFDDIEESIQNENVVAYVKKTLKKRYKTEIDFWIGIEENAKYRVYCLQEEDAKAVATFLKENIHHSKAQLIKKESWDEIIKFSHTKKLQLEKKADNLFDMCYTEDIRQNVFDLLHNDAAVMGTFELPFPKMVLEFFQSFGQDILDRLKENFDVNVLEQRPGSLLLKGSVSNQKEIKRFLKNEVSSLRRSIPAPVSVKRLKAFKTDIDKDMKKYQCCWTYQKPYCDAHLMNCEYVASWVHWVSETKLTIVKGNPCYINFDLHIVFANQSLVPLDYEALDSEAWDEFMGICRKNLESKKANVKVSSVIHPFFVKDGLESEKATVIVAIEDKINARAVIEKTQLQTCIGTILQQAERDGDHYVGIRSYVTENLIKEEHIVKSILESFDDYSTSHSGSNSTELLICCNDENCDKLEMDTENFFKGCKGYGRVIHSKGGKLKKDKEPNFKVKVKLGLMHNTEAEVLVNSTRNDLDLNSGNVSRQLLQMAGDELQKECNTKYPNGISCKDVAVTRSYNLKNQGSVKHIFHISLPKYNYETFRKDLLVVVKKCLFQADRLNCNSIAFPALGVGNLNYPRRETAATMFEAVEEYGSEVIKGSLKKIKFVVFDKDKHTCHAFIHEGWRRSKKYEKETKDPPDLPLRAHFSQDIGKSDELTLKAGDLHVLVTTEEREKFPSFVVHVFFNGESQSVDGDEPYLKQASCDPKSWNDLIYLSHVRDEKSFKEKLYKCNPKLSEERVTELAVHTFRGKGFMLSEGEQVSHILRWLERIKLEEPIFLQRVTILVSDVAGLQSAKYHFEKDKHILMEDVPHYDETLGPRLTVEMVGKSKELLECAEKNVKCVIDSIKEEMMKRGSSTERKGTQTNDVVPKKPVEISCEAQSQPSDSQPREEIQEHQDADIITAEINPGIVQVKKSQGEMKFWVEEMKKKFPLEIIWSMGKSETTVVKGSFENILRFEAYLEKMFTSSSSAKVHDLQHDDILETEEDYYSIENKETVIYFDMTQSEYESFVKLPVFAKILSGNKWSRIGYESPQKRLMAICADEYADLLGKELHQLVTFLRRQDKRLRNDKGCYNYILSGLSIAVHEGSITDENVDCCIVLAPPRLDKQFYGLLGYLSQIEGNKLKKAILSSGKELLGVEECRLVNTEFFEFTDRIILVLMPDKPRDHLDKVLFKCLKTADEAGCFSVALPFIASNVKNRGIPIEDCADMYMKALKDFKEEAKYIRRIIFVDINKENTNKVKSKFGANFAPYKRPVSQKTTAQLVLQSQGLQIEQQGITVYAVIGDSSKYDEDAYVCFVDENFKNSEQYFTDVCEPYKLKITSEQKLFPKIGQVMDIASTMGNLSSRPVVLAVLPPMQHLTEENEETIRKIAEEVLSKAAGSSVRSLGVHIPRFKSEAEKLFCMMLVRKFINVCQTRGNGKLDTIKFIASDDTRQSVVADTVCQVLEIGSLV